MGCATDNGGCMDVCTNTEGDFECSCYCSWSSVGSSCPFLGYCNHCYRHEIHVGRRRRWIQSCTSSTIKLIFHTGREISLLQPISFKRIKTLRFYSGPFPWTSSKQTLQRLLFVTLPHALFFYFLLI